MNSGLSRTDFAGIFSKSGNERSSDDEEMMMTMMMRRRRSGNLGGRDTRNAFLFPEDSMEENDNARFFQEEEASFFPLGIHDEQDWFDDYENIQEDNVELEEDNEEEESPNMFRDKRRRRRRRHFSLEDYSHESSMDDHSEQEPFLLENSLINFPPHQQHSSFNDESFKLQTSLVPEDAVSIDRASDFICAQVLCELETKLWNTLKSTNDKVILLPEGLLTVIAKHVLQEGSQEPCGLKGCRVNIYFEGFSDVQLLGTLVCDPETVPTFQLNLTLRQSPKTWGNLLRRQSYVDISTSYKLVKKCLYREDSPPYYENNVF